MDDPSLRKGSLLSNVSHKLSAEEKATYEWQMWVDGFGEAGQQKLKDATVMISRVGGLGSVVAYELAAAGVGHLIIAHGGNIKHSDLNRQLLMTHARIGTPRIESAADRLRELNPHLQITAIAENVTMDNVSQLTNEADLIVDCAPLFTERFIMNEAAISRNIPLVECAMFDLEFQLTTIVPRKTPCLRCLYPQEVPHWRRQFPVFGAVSATVGAMGAMEAIKVLAGLDTPLYGKLLCGDLRSMNIRTLTIHKDPKCPACAK